METLKQRDWLIAIHGIEGVGRKTITRLFERLDGNLAEVGNLSFEEYKSIGSSKKAEATYHAITDVMTETGVGRIHDTLASMNISCVTLLDDHYPKLLKETPDPPWVIYCKGNIALLSSFSITVVGTRHPTSYGKAATKSIVTSLVGGGATIVSGLARGIDSIAHHAALEGDGSTIAVLGCGIDIVYPPENGKLYESIATRGLIVSEYPPGTNPHPGLFPERNRIISGLSYGTVVIEANARSGSLITTDQAIEQGRDVFALPGPITSPRSDGPNILIQQGAKLVRNGDDILEEYPLHRITAKKEDRILASLTEEERGCLELITAEPLHIEDIINSLNLPAHKVQSLLLSLQLKKQLVQLPGQVYRRNIC